MSEETVHYFDKAKMAYTACWQLSCGQMAVEHTDDPDKVTCPSCRAKVEANGKVG